MDLTTWHAAMDAEPTNNLTLHAFSDWLQERNDPAWEPMAELARLGKTGHTGTMLGRRGLYTDADRGLSGEPACGHWPGVIDPHWFDATLDVMGVPQGMNALGLQPSTWRPALCQSWLAASARTRKRWQYVTSLTSDESAVKPSRADARDWLIGLAGRLRVSYDDLMENAERYQEHRPFDWSLNEDVEMPDELWSHWAVVTGKVPRRTGDFFTCSC